jgi:hypothetical protein
MKSSRRFKACGLDLLSPKKCNAPSIDIFRDTRYLQGYEKEDVLEALATHHRENPDKRDPQWKPIMAYLRDHAAVAHNDWVVFISTLRRAAIDARLPGCRNMSDQDLFQGYLTANSHQHNLDGHPLADPDGHRARLARWFRYTEGRRWTEYLRKINEPVPDWLFTERDDTVTCAAPAPPVSTETTCEFLSMPFKEEQHGGPGEG